MKRLFMCMETFIAGVAAVTLIGHAHAADTGPALEFTRLDLVGAFNALSAIGQYADTKIDGGKEVPVLRFLNVSDQTASTLAHDATILRSIAIETASAKMTAEDRARKEAPPDILADAQRLAEVLARADAAIDQTVLVMPSDFVQITELDWNRKDNKQITPTLAAMLAPLTSTPTGKALPKPAR